MGRCQTFAKAEVAVADDDASLRRVQAEKFCVLFADLNQRNPANGKIADSEDAFARRLADFARIGRALKIRTIGRREAGIVSDWLSRIARLRLTSEPWYSDILMERLISNPEKTLGEQYRK